ncbi:MAG: glycosyltransferase [Chloroflexi bacterium]|nr:glycosyltransferase [Chloroflexota bacterium]
MKLALVAPAPIPAQTANSIQGMKMAQAIVRLGHDLRVYAPGTASQLSWPQLAEHYGLSEKFEIQWLPSLNFLRRYDYAWRAIRAASAWGADVIYTRLPQAAALGARRGIPTIFEVHDLPSGRLGPRLLQQFLRGPGARRLVVITQALADALAARFPLPENAGFVLIAPDAVDIERYAELPKAEGARKELGLAQQFTVGYSGHLYPGRGIELILDVAQQLPEVQFLLIGGNPDDVARVQNQAAGLANLHLTGFVTNASLPRYQAACDVLLMPYQEQVAASSGGNIAGFLSPMKMFEYLASGRPVLTSDLPVLREVLNNENALILPMADAPAWARAIQELQGNSKKRDALSRAARQTAARHTWTARAERILSGV